MKFLIVKLIESYIKYIRLMRISKYSISIWKSSLRLNREELTPKTKWLKNSDSFYWDNLIQALIQVWALDSNKCHQDLKEFLSIIRTALESNNCQAKECLIRILLKIKIFQKIKNSHSYLNLNQNNSLQGIQS
jgi:hypothetical protein